MTNQLQGIMANSAVGVIRREAGVSSLVVRSAGVVTTPPSEWSPARFGDAAADHPDYSNAALLVGINKLVSGQGAASSVEFGGISTGGDVTPSILPNGQLAIFDSWYFLSVNIAKKAGTQSYGVPGSVLSTLTNPERAILSYYAEGSTGIDEALVNATAVEQTSVQLGFTNSGVSDTIEGLDWGIGLISVDPNSTRSLIMAPVRGRFFFSVTAAWAGNHPAHGLDARTIYQMNWQSAGSGYEWTVPIVAFSSLELFGSNAPETVEIDAISVYRRSSIRRVVFSATPQSGLSDEILGWDATHGIPGAQPLRTASGTLVSARLGLAVGGTDRDNVNGTCGTDPVDSSILDGVLGAPKPDPTNVRTDLPLGLAVYRAIEGPTGSSTDLVHVTVTGLDPARSGEAWVHFQAGLPGVPPLSLGLLPVQPSDSTLSLVIPGNLGALGTLQFTATSWDAVGTPLRRSLKSELNY